MGRVMVMAVGLFGTLGLRARAQTISWLQQFGGQYNDKAWGVAADTSGIYVVGQTAAAGSGGLPEMRSFLRKYSPVGSEIWGRELNGTARRAAVDSNGVYVVGPGLQKFSRDGAEIWVRQFDTSFSFLSVASIPDGVYIAGFVLPTNPGTHDAIVRKYDAAGNEVWTRVFGGADHDEALGLAADATGVYVVGQTQGGLPGRAKTGTRDAFVRKYDFAGNELWTREFGTAQSAQAVAAAVDPTGVYIVGELSGALPGHSSAGSGDAFIRKYDADGNEVWTRQFGTSASDGAYSVASNDGAIYVAGETLGVFSGQTAAATGSAYVRSYSASGGELWTLQFGTPEFGSAQAVATASTSVYVAGESKTSLFFSDAFLARIETETIP